MLPLLAPGIKSLMETFTNDARGSARTASGDGERVQLYASNFWLHLLGTTEVVTCGLDVPGWKHHYLLSIEAGALKGDTTPLQVIDGSAIMDLDGWDLTIEIAGADPAVQLVRGELEQGIPKEDPTSIESWRILDLMPDFTQFCVGAHLSAGWPQRTGIATTVRMKAGSFCALPAVYTFENTWSWTGPGGREHRQAIADVLDYASTPGDRVVLMLTERRPRGRSYPLELAPNKGRPWALTLVGFPDGWSHGMDPVQQYELELAHVHATLRLCDVEAQDFRAVVAPTPHPIPEDKIPSFRQPGQVEVMLPGRINCAGRLMFVE